MKKILLTAIITLIGIHTATAQVGIGTEAPKTSLQVVGKPASTTTADGVQVPSLSLAQLDAKISAYGTDQNGTIVYIDDVTNTSTTAQTGGINAVGFYYYDADNQTWKTIGNNFTLSDASVTNAKLDKTNIPLSGFGTAQADIDLGSNKILFSNVYSTINDLPAAGDYHGMFAHVHGTGKAYYAHAGNWVEIANKGELNLALVLAENNSTNNQKIKDLADPTEDQDAVTKVYVDNLIAELQSQIPTVPDAPIITSVTAGEGQVDVAFKAPADDGVLAINSYTATSDPDAITGTLSQAGDGTITVSGLTNDIAYKFTITGTNGLGTGSPSSASNSVTPTILPLTDTRDDKHYNVVKIGDQVWMAENLAYLPSVNQVASGSEDAAGSYYYVYGYDGTNVTDAKAKANYTTYGVLYNWTAAMDGETSSSSIPSGIQGVCPTGWHLPSDDEWTQLTDYLGANAGGKMKSTGTQYWSSPNTDATNESGFSGLPGGIRLYHGPFDYVGAYGSWWSSSEDRSDYAWQRIIYYENGYVHSKTLNKNFGAPVRCLRD